MSLRFLEPSFEAQRSSIARTSGSGDVWESLDAETLHAPVMYRGVAIVNLIRPLILPHFLRRTGIRFVGKCSSRRPHPRIPRSRLRHC
ncbi:hypothetical protein, partial [uncultured Methylobacterium sp.]|uniref:hypothetical protein n=1 Tax=uncultured Methylobacterium sp. TaxID=157278 RepID=UPI0025985848